MPCKHTHILSNEKMNLKLTFSNQFTKCWMIGSKFTNVTLWLNNSIGELSEKNNFVYEIPNEEKTFSNSATVLRSHNHSSCNAFKYSLFSIVVCCWQSFNVHFFFSLPFYFFYHRFCQFFLSRFICILHFVNRAKR